MIPFWALNVYTLFPFLSEPTSNSSVIILLQWCALAPNWNKSRFDLQLWYLFHHCPVSVTSIMQDSCKCSEGEGHHLNPCSSRAVLLCCTFCHNCCFCYWGLSYGGFISVSWLQTFAFLGGSVLNVLNSGNLRLTLSLSANFFLYLFP